MVVRSLHLRVARSAVLLLLPPGAWCQTHRVEKPQKVVRAVAVYEWTGDLNKPLASRLVPVSLFINGELEDAGVYLARPVPFALDPGYVYSVEKAGEPLGILDLDEARNVVTRRSTEDDNPITAWFGYGRYIPPAAVAKPPVLHASAHPGVIVASNTGNRPHFSGRPAEETPKGKDQSEGSGGKATKSSSPSQNAPSADDAGADKPLPAPASKPAATDDDDRPHMSRRSETTATEVPVATTGTTATPAADGETDRPTLRRRDASTDAKTEAKKQAKESGSGVRSMATSLNDDPDRPTLHRGTEEVPTGTPPLSGNPPGVQQRVAVSDPNTVDNHPFARTWQSAGERASTLTSFQALARPRVANYLALNELQPGTALMIAPAPASEVAQQSAGATKSASAPNGTVNTEDTGGAPRLQRGRPSQAAAPLPPAIQPAKPPAAAAAVPPPVVRAQAAAAHHSTTTSSRAASHRTKGRSAAALPLLLQDEALTGYELSYGGLPTFVYTATTPTSTGSAVHITLIAQLLPTGELQVALSSVTDEAHLDRAPWMRLVDVVDPNDSHRASFLFELRARASRQFALYRLVSARAEQTFLTGIMQ